MSTTKQLKFNAKYTLRYVNDIYILTRLTGVSIHIHNDDIDDILEKDIENMSDKEWSAYAYDYNLENKI